MAKVCLICGKICSGKTWYARRLRESLRAVILSTDEVTWDLIDNEQGERYDAFAKRVNLYLRKKAVEIAKAGANVILDWGFWTRESRREISDYLASNGVAYEWYYVRVDGERWKKNIAERNRRIGQGNRGPDFYVDEGLIKKVESLFCPPEDAEMDFICEGEETSVRPGGRKEHPADIPAQGTGGSEHDPGAADD